MLVDHFCQNKDKLTKPLLLLLVAWDPAKKLIYIDIIIIA